MKTIKKFIIINLLLVVYGTSSLMAQSSVVKMKTVTKVAQNFMSNNCNVSKIVSNVIVEKFEEQNSFYVVNFKEGGWVMVSAESSAVPILAFSNEGTYRMEDAKPAALLYLIDNYKEQIAVSRKIAAKQIDSVRIDTAKRREIAIQWENLQVAENRKILKSYIPGTHLLGAVKWGQSTNNSGGCNPAYNAKITKSNPLLGLIDDCSCDERPPAGCAAVAMGQAMWYYQWPKSSKYRTYNWNNIPTELNNASSTAQANEIGFLLKDCGTASNMTYACAGSFALLENVAEALKNEFAYKGALKINRDGWNYNVWNDLIRTEIDCKRPVIYKGEKNIVSGEKHYFIVDGYDVNNNNYFHFNWGWNGKNYNNNDSKPYFYLNDITPGSHNYNARQNAIIGISPTYLCNENITDVPYQTLTYTQKEEVQQNITLPLTGKNLTVKNSGDLTLIAGNSIILKSGFKAEAGSHFIAKVVPQYQDSAANMNILATSFPTQMNRENGMLQVSVTNVNSFDFTVKDASNNQTI
ncbi:MAG: C10 family peptidase, partial [Bacteroidales bacterium]|nr:C10 family peptidase [Bacteroidales bacterium]